MPSDNGEQTFSIWLIPEEPEFHALQSIIHENQRSGNQPFFIPHVTLLSGISSDKGMKEVLKMLGTDCSPFSVECRNPETGDDYYHCLYVPIIFSEELKRLRKRAKKLFPNSSGRPFMPHLSLMYHDPNSDLVLKHKSLLSDFSILKLTITFLELWNTTGPVNDWSLLNRKKMNL